MVRPTPEQEKAVEVFGAGEHIVLLAGAGTGKTTTLAMLAASQKDKLGRYIAFNRSIANEAGRTFPPNVSCKTAHSMAWAAVGRQFGRRMNGPRVPSWKTGLELGITMSIRLGKREVSSKALSYTTLQTVVRFCQSADDEIVWKHVPHLRGLDANRHPELADAVLPYAKKAWADLQNPEGGVVRFNHDHYLKMWALTRPVISGDFLLLDEAQDTNPVVEKLFCDQRSQAQLVMVGDSAQAIYGWRGARDVMSGFDGARLSLSQSFRFGPRLAAEANRWLAIAEAPIRLIGSAAVNTELGPIARPEVILCRSNVGAMTEVIRLLDAGRKVALVGGGKALADLAKAARDLKAGKRTYHPELMLFRNWDELQDYAEEDPSGRDLQPMVDLINEHGVEVILAAVERLTEEETFAEVTVSTAHRAKGREWNTVRIFDDFLPPLDSDDVDSDGEPIPGPIDDGEARLAYVAVTRARHRLDLGGLGWIDGHPDGRPAGTPRVGSQAGAPAAARPDLNVWDMFRPQPPIT
ncbi:MAG: UvrD-helicase domain-containing protein [Catenulispora sp.]